MKTFTAQILDTSLEAAIEGLPGWSHAGDISKSHTFYYPFERDQRRIYFTAKNRTQAILQLLRCVGADPKEVHEHCSERPETFVARKRKCAVEICKRETFVGNYSRFPFWQKVCGI